MRVFGLKPLFSSFPRNAVDSKAHGHAGNPWMTARNPSILRTCRKVTGTGTTFDGVTPEGCTSEALSD